MVLEVQAGMAVCGWSLLVGRLAEGMITREVEGGGRVALGWGDRTRKLRSEHWRRGAYGAAMAALGAERLLVWLRENSQRFGV